MKEKLIITFFSILIIMSLTVVSHAQYDEDDWNAYKYIGGRTLNVQKITIGARQAGMGEAFTGLANDVNCGSYNPAGYALLNYKTISASHNEWLAESNYNFFVFAMPYGKGTFSTALTYFDEGTIKEADLKGQLTGDELGVSDFQFSLGYARKVKFWFFPRMYMGINARFLQYRLAYVHRGAFLGDVGWLVPISGRKLSFGLSVQNLGTAIQELPDEDELPPTLIRTGLGSELFDTESVDLNLTGDMTLRKPFLEGGFSPRFNLGSELWLKDLLALRVGYKIGYDLEDLTFGAGFKIGDYQVDYAMVDYSDAFKATHRLTASMTFGKVARPDRDGDGIYDDVDQCPDEPEDKDQYQDTDGCPDYDNDQDGIFDEDDSCPNMPEYMNGFEDEDGCPDVKPAEIIQQTPGTEEKQKTGADMAKSQLEEVMCEDERGFYYLLAGYDYVRPIVFDTDKATILPESKVALTKIAKIIEQCIREGDMVEVRGHADDRGDTQYNLELSKRRANAVREYMINNFQLPADKLIAVGVGESEPVMPNTSEEYMQFNRRVVFRVIEQGEE